ncbi:transposase, partial [Candidatus Gracilibacteria bacterium]|nr:transposase [Candidatus Gracilibacteria bacterium]
PLRVKIPKTFTKKEIQQINNNSKKEQKEKMQKYKNEAEQRLKTEQINPKMLKNKKGKQVEYKEITLDYFLEQGYRKLFLTREKNLSPIQKLRISQIFQEFDYRGYLAESWNIKEDFMQALDDLDIQEIDRIIQDCKNSEHMRIQQFGRTLANRYEGIHGFCKYSTEEFKFTNAFTEVTNKICKDGKRQANGFRLKQNYFKKIFVKCMINKLKYNLIFN